MKKEWQIEIENWIKKLQPNVLIKFWIVVKVLNEEKELLDGINFSIPYSKLEQNKLPRQEAEKILFNLHDHDIVQAVRVEAYAESPKGLKISTLALTEGISLINPKFEYLHTLLKSKVNISKVIPILKVSFSPDLYDEKNATLKLNNQKVKIPPKTNMDYLCQIIFLKLNKSKVEKNSLAKKGLKEWSSDELLDLSDGLIAFKNNKQPWRPIYNAVDGVNDRIAKQTQTQNFLEKIGVKTFRINPKYLK